MFIVLEQDPNFEGIRLFEEIDGTIPAEESHLRLDWSEVLGLLSEPESAVVVG